MTIDHMKDLVANQTIEQAIDTLDDNFHVEIWSIEKDEWENHMTHEDKVKFVVALGASMV